MPHDRPRHGYASNKPVFALGVCAARSFLGTHRQAGHERAYGLLAREFLLALNHLQSARGLNIVLIGALETVTDDYGHVEHRLQAEGQRVPNEIAGIVDIVVTMQMLDFSDNKPAQRGFVCTSPNPWKYPGKDRSGKLEMIEPPDLGALIRKVVPPRASHATATEHGIQPQQQQGEPIPAAHSNTETKAA